MTPDQIRQEATALVDHQLNLEDGQMMMPLKTHEIGGLIDAIVALVQKNRSSQ